MPQCDECKGTGWVELFTSRRPCSSCAGSPANTRRRSTRVPFVESVRTFEVSGLDDDDGCVSQLPPGKCTIEYVPVKFTIKIDLAEFELAVNLAPEQLNDLVTAEKMHLALDGYFEGMFRNSANALDEQICAIQSSPPFGLLPATSPMEP